VQKPGSRASWFECLLCLFGFRPCYQLKVTNADGSRVYGASRRCSPRAMHEIHVADIYLEVRDSGNLRTVKLVAEGGTEPSTGGFAFVEYV
jgi:hypothetical protein